MTNVAALTVKLDALKDARADAQAKYEKARKGRTWGLFGILIGIPLLLAYGLGLLFIIAGILAALTQAGKASDAKRHLEAIDAEIEKVRRAIIAAAEQQNQ